MLVAGCLVERYGRELASELPEADGFMSLGSYGRATEVVDGATGRVRASRTVRWHIGETFAGSWVVPSTSVVGDQLYGGTTNPLGRLGLHAKLLGFSHPTTGKKMSFVAPLPKSFRELFRLARM